MKTLTGDSIKPNGRNENIQIRKQRKDIGLPLDVRWSVFNDYFNPANFNRDLLVKIYLITTLICLLAAAANLPGVIAGETIEIASFAICIICAQACALCGILSMRK
jgi:hypothetical protein